MDLCGSNSYYFKKITGEEEWSEDIRVTNDSAYSINPRIAVDSNNNVHIVWEDNRDGNYWIYYTKLDNQGNTLIDDKQILSLPFIGSNELFTYDAPSIAMDSNDNIHLAFIDYVDSAIYEVFYVKLDNNGTILGDIKRVDNNLALKRSPDIAVDSDNNVHIVWEDYTDYPTEVYYSKLDSSGNIIINSERLTYDTKASGFPKIAVDSSNNIHVVSGGALDYYFPDIAIDSNDNRHNVWCSEGNPQWMMDPGIYYKKLDKNGNTVIYTKLIIDSDNVTRPVIANDSNDNIHVIWLDSRGEKFEHEIYYTKLDNAGNKLINDTQLTFDPASPWKPDIAIYSNDKVHITWQDERDGNWEIYYKSNARIMGKLIKHIYITYPHDPKPYAENLNFCIGQVINLHTEVSEIPCRVTGEIQRIEGGGSYWSFDLYNDGHPWHGDEIGYDAVYSNKLILPKLPKGNYSFVITAKKGGEEDVGKLDFNITGFPDGVLNVNLSIVDKTPKYTYKNEELSLIANVTDSTGKPYKTAIVNALIILPNQSVEEISFKNLDNGTYTAKYIPQRGGFYQFETSAYSFLAETLDYIGGFDVGRIKVLKGNLSITSSDLGRYKVGEDVPLEVNITSDGKGVKDEVNVIAEILKEGRVIDTIPLTGEYVTYKANYSAEESGMFNVTYNATSTFYKPASAKNNFTITPELVELKKVVKSFSDHSIEKIDKLQRMMKETGDETEYFKEKVTETKLEIVADIVFDSAGALLSHMGTDQGVREYLLKYASLKNVIKTYSMKALGETPSSYTGDALKNAVTGIINTFGKLSYTSPEKGYYKAAKGIFDLHRNKIEEEKKTTINNLPPLISEEEKILIEDLKSREIVLDYAVVREAECKGRYLKEVYEEDKSQEEGWLPDLMETLAWTGAYVGAGFLSDGPCIGWVFAAQLACDMHNDMKELNKYQKLHMAGTELFWKYPESSYMVYNNTVTGLKKVRNGVIEEKPEGEISTIRQLSIGGRDFLNNWVEDEGYFDVKIKNKGDRSAAYRVYAWYTNKYGIPEFISYEMDEDEKAGVMLNPRESRWVKVYWKNEHVDVRPEKGEDINFVLVSYTPGEYRGIYYNDYKHVVFDPEQVESSIIALSGLAEVEVNKTDTIISRPIDVFVAAEENIEVYITASNPYPMPVSVNITQKFENSTMNFSWNKMLSPHESITLNYTIINVTGWTELPPVIMGIYSPSKNQTVTFKTETMTIYVGNKPPIAAFIVTGDQIINENIKFQSISADIEGYITKYEWNFGDGNITSTPDPIITHSYTEARNYSINLTVTDNDGATNSTTKTITVYPLSTGFDTGSPANPYPSISGTHTGTITPSENITVHRLYTYPCEGTGGHTEYARIYGNGIDKNASWNGYNGDWQYIYFDNSFVLEEGKTYNYTIITGSYPQIIHESPFNATGGTINCTRFIDANGRTYTDWIPAIRLE